jgi:hypothetical protein
MMRLGPYTSIGSLPSTEGTQFVTVTGTLQTPGWSHRKFWSGGRSDAHPAKRTTTIGTETA